MQYSYLPPGLVYPYIGALWDLESGKYLWQFATDEEDVALFRDDHADIGMITRSAARVRSPPEGATGCSRGPNSAPNA